MREIDELDFCAGEMGRSWCDIQVRQRYGSLPDAHYGRSRDQNIVKGLRELAWGESHSACGISLRITIYKQNALLSRSEARGQVNSGCGLPDSAFLVCHRDYSAHAGSDVVEA
jgi:hypothetical protein